MWEAIAGLITIIAAILKYYFQEKQRKGVRTFEDDITEMDLAIANRDADTISRLFNELRAPKGSSESDTIRQNDKGTSKR